MPLLRKLMSKLAEMPKQGFTGVERMRGTLSVL